MKKYSTKAVVFFILSLFLFSCNEYKGYKKTESGLYYKFFIQNTNARVPQNDDIVTINMEIRNAEDSLIQAPKIMSVMMQPSKFQADIFDALSMMHQGDSASFIINAKKYFNAYNYGNQPYFVDDKAMLWFTITLKDIVTSTEYKAKQIQMLMDEEKVLIQQYLVDNKINVLPSASGLYYMESKKGKGKSPVKGQLCKVNYKGMLLDGTVFDSSQGREPFAFQLGEGQVIKGWDEGIALMQKGGKALLLIPSHLAYGERGAGDMIPPYSPLLFEVELIDFK
ncbi:MAG: FKBP-type peptidyl-prolyl cis-trans isomerase [Bacteroidales bacterium]|jgi:FKBP-type peptidyl-prolyl cis-trans isomerase|nr:FKBP-type peptidyl-prolyl cis-trans isomerase [Bacteroidales bacterium]MDD3330269.1 FKBP-type peptidyl-prolyl cis-trans isomerase [Bacteroidales bacterium]MDD4580998.1 FKBP-type peptidyl-prolyl cis-trans isomerase [Bacteroidales bacterium]MDX9889304.1 FKBP-type peptidyl-prolyl cis-trans isomerase [Bacteroidales bacterium]NLO42066.1 hypothetical protein [Bacteroidales bacterium]